MAPVLAELKRRRPTEWEEAMLSRLTPAELRVVVALASGITNNDEIADHLRVSVHTVRSPVQSALRKPALDDRTQLALRGARHHLGTAPAEPTRVRFGGGGQGERGGGEE